MDFSVRLEPNGQGGFIARLPDLPDEVLTEGSTREEAIANAAEALELALLGRMKDGEPIPVPSAKRAKADGVAHVSAQAAAKLVFYKAFVDSGTTRAALARKLGKDEAEIRRMLDPYHATKLAALDDALRALGQRLVLEIQPA